MKPLIKSSRKAQVMYIQGFADGEGCCTKDGRQIIITQKSPLILKEVQESLTKTFGIKSTLHYVKSKDAHRLIVTGQINIKRFYHFISFRDLKKQERLLFGVNDFKRKSACYEDYLLATKLWKEGYSLRTISKRIGVSHGAVFKWIHNIAKPVSLPKKNRDIHVN